MSDSDTRYEDRLNSIAKAVSDVARNQQMFTQRQRQQEEFDLESRIEMRAKELESQFKRAEDMVGSAEKAVAAAYESGEPGEIARANRALTEAVAARESARADVHNHQSAREEYNQRRERERKQAQQQQQQPAPPRKEADFTNLNEWKQRNADWYGVDVELTKAAHEIDRVIRAADTIDVGSKEYFEAIDRQMARKYPDRFNKSPDTASGSSAAPSTNSAQAGRIPSSVVNTWRKMGIDVDDPKVMERMVMHRQTAVQKGILPETPVYEAIRT